MTQCLTTPPFLDDSVERAFKRFHSDLIQGRGPSITEVLRELNRQNDTELFKEFLEYELQWDCEAGKEAAVETYLSRYPEWASAIAEIVSEQNKQTRQRRVGKYLIYGRPRQGTFSDVYFGRHVTLGRTAAIKLLRSLDVDQLRRFKQEASVLAKLKHRHILQIYEVDEHDGKPFIATEPAVRNLAEILTPGPLGVSVAVEYGIQIAEALVAAHSQGVIHRDLKPQNVLLDQEGMVKVCDFGLAKIIGGEGTNTEISAIVGTPLYMSPEQMQGRNEIVGIASDIYGFGAVFYHLLTGTTPFIGNDRQELGEQVIEATPPKPSERNEKVNRALDEICLKCLEKNPVNRFESMDDVVRSLKVYKERKSAFFRKTALVTILALVLSVILVSATISRNMAVSRQSPGASSESSDGVHTAPSLSVFHRIGRETRRLIDANYGGITDGDILELEARVTRQRFKYLLSVGGDGVPKVFAENELVPDGKGAWRWQPGPPECETIILMTTPRRLSATEIENVESEIEGIAARLKLEPEQQIVWENGSWRTVVPEWIPRGTPLPATSEGWADNVLRILINRGLTEFSGRSIHVKKK